MDIFYTNNITLPVSSAYIGDSDLKFKRELVTIDDGFTVVNERYLEATKSNRINNYSSLYLTDLVENNDILEIDSIKYEYTQQFVTSIKFNELYLTFQKNNTPIFTTKYNNDTLFDVILIDEQTLHITHRVGSTVYYLQYNGEFWFSSQKNLKYAKFYYVIDGNELYLQYKIKNTLYSVGIKNLTPNKTPYTVFSLSAASGATQLFLPDVQNWSAGDKLTYFNTISNTPENTYITMADYTGLISIMPPLKCNLQRGKRIDNVTETTITTLPQFSITSHAIWKRNAFKINKPTLPLATNLNSSWASYVPLYKNCHIVRPEKSISNLKCHNIVHGNYTTITGNSIPVNIITLKSHHTNKNYSYRANNLLKTDLNVPNLYLRDYNFISTGVDQEMGSDSITLTYEFYNTDYKFKADTYTTFKTPAEMYPYDKVNLNDTLISRNGAIAGDTPYTADKIYRNSSNDIGVVGRYLCSWLSGSDPDSPTQWVDRYYIPERTTYFNALSEKSNRFVDPYVDHALNTPITGGDHDGIFIYNSISAESLEIPHRVADVLVGESFYDKKSDLALTPDTEYIFHHIGNQYVELILQSLTGNLIHDGLEIRTSTNSEIAIDVDKINDRVYIFNNNRYSFIDTYEPLNDNREFSLSFWLDADRWNQKLGFEILGNFNDRGFGVFSDQNVTPIIMLQDEKQVLFLNSDFDVFDRVVFTQEELNSRTLTSEIVTEDSKTTTISMTSFFVKEILRGDHLDYSMPIIAHYVEKYQRVEPYYFVPRCGIIATEDYLRIVPENVFSPISGIPLSAFVSESCYLVPEVPVISKYSIWPNDNTTVPPPVAFCYDTLPPPTTTVTAYSVVYPADDTITGVYPTSAELWFSFGLVTMPQRAAYPGYEVDWGIFSRGVSACDVCPIVIAEIQKVPNSYSSDIGRRFN